MTARKAAALAAVLAGVLCTATSVRAATNYEYTKGLVDHSLRFHDLAERFLKKLESGRNPGDKAEAMLGMAYLCKGQADIMPRRGAKGPDGKSPPQRRRDKYNEGLAFIEKYTRAAPKGYRLNGEALGLKSAIQEELTRVYKDLMASLTKDDPEWVELNKRQMKIRLQAVENLRKGMLDAERAYAAGLRAWRDPAAGNQPGAKAKKDKLYGAYVLASQKYFRALVKSADSLNRDSSEQKAMGEKIVNVVKAWIKHQDDKTYDPPPEGVQMINNYFIARGYVFAGKVDKAVEEGFNKILEIDPELFPKANQPWAWSVRLTSMMFMAMALFDKAEKTKVHEDYQAALQAISFEFGTHASGTVLGIRAVILKGRVLGRLKEHTQAISELKGALDKIKALIARRGRDAVYAGDLRWRALQAMSDVVLGLLQQGKTIDVSPEVLIEAGRSCYRQTNYEAAVGCFRQAINASMKLPYKERALPRGEPLAWYFMGIAYFRMKNHLEAQLAYEGALDNFLGQNIPKEFREDPKNKKLLKEIRDDVLKRCVGNGRIAATLERGLNPSKFNKDRFLEWIKWGVKLDPSMAKDLPYYMAVAIKGEADGMARKASPLESDGQKQLARAVRKEALNLYEKAKLHTDGEGKPGGFRALPKSSTWYEEGVYLIGVCNYQAMGVLGYKGRSKAERDKAVDLAKRALGQFDAYEKWIADNPPRVRIDDARQRAVQLRVIRDRRKSHKNAISLYRPFIYFDLEEYQKALDSAEGLRTRRDLESGQKRSLHRILFKCYAEIATKQTDLTKLESFLKKGEVEAEWFNKEAERAETVEDKASLRNSFDFYLNRLATAYGDAVKIAIRQGKGETLGKAFQRRRGELINQLLKNPKYQTIDGLGLVAKLFIELKDYDEARKAYDKMIEKFDPDNDRMGMADDKLVKVEDLKLRRALENTKRIVEGGRRAMTNARRRLDAIDAFVHGRKADPKTRKPAVAKDYDKAVRSIEAFLRDIPGYDSEKGGKPGPARTGIEDLKKELLFRLKLLRAANGRTTCYVELGLKLLAENEKDEAKKAFEQGLGSAKDALKYWPKDADVRYNQAICQLHAAGGNKDMLKDAKAGFDNLRVGSVYNGETYWKAVQGAVRARIELAEFDAARTILARLLLTAEDDVKKGWPEVLEYVKTVAKKKNMKIEDFLGKKVDIKRFDYRPRSELERLVELKKALVLPGYVTNGKITEEIQKLRVSLLEEMVEMEKARKFRGKIDDPLDIAEKISTGRITSLKNMGGKSRGVENDKHQPKLIKGAGKKGADAGRAVPARAHLAARLLGGTC